MLAVRTAMLALATITIAAAAVSVVWTGWVTPARSGDDRLPLVPALVTALCPTPGPWFGCGGWWWLVVAHHRVI